MNDFNLFGRTWQVIIQGEAVDRKDVEDIYRINVRNAQGTMVPIRALADVAVSSRSRQPSTATTT